MEPNISNLCLFEVLTDSVNWPSVWQKPECVVKHSSTVEYWRGEPRNLFKSFLESTQFGTHWIFGLVVQVVLSKRKHWNKGCPSMKQEISQDGTQHLQMAHRERRRLYPHWNRSSIKNCFKYILPSTGNNCDIHKVNVLY